MFVFLVKDDCAVSNGGCSQVCNPSPYEYLCSCEKGYRLLPDGKTCEGIHFDNFKPELPKPSHHTFKWNYELSG